MSADKGGDRPPIDQRLRENIESGFSGGRKLYGDMFNIWARLSFFTHPEKIQTLKPLLHYKQYMEEAKSSEGKSRYSSEGIDYVMQLSDAESVATFDRLVDEFNADIERIKQTNDVATIQNFLDRAKELVYKKG